MKSIIKTVVSGLAIAGLLATHATAMSGAKLESAGFKFNNKSKVAKSYDCGKTKGVGAKFRKAGFAYSSNKAVKKIKSQNSKNLLAKTGFRGKGIDKNSQSRVSKSNKRVASNSDANKKNLFGMLNGGLLGGLIGHVINPNSAHSALTGAAIGGIAGNLITGPQQSYPIWPTIQPYTPYTGWGNGYGQGMMTMYNGWGWNWI